MASLTTISATGLMLYFILRDKDSLVWNTDTLALEAFNAANYDDYDIAGGEQGSTGYYYASTPATLPVGRYRIDWRSQVGASPAESDQPLAFGSAYWDGAAWVPDWAVKIARSVTPIADSIEEDTGTTLPAAIAAFAGTGARAVAITVNDGATELESARVRVTKGAVSCILSTSAAGLATFSLDDGTWTVAITLPGYTFASTTLVVDGDETQTYSMTVVSISAPATPNCTTGYCTCIGTDGAIEAGVKVYAQMTAGPGTAGYALDRGLITMTSDVAGLAQHTGFVRGATYKFRRGTDRWWGDEHAAPDAASWSLEEILGLP